VTRFERYVLRTTDLAAARAFYAELIGAAEIEPLPADAIARGARPHWLGTLGVDDVDLAARELVARGATRVGPPHAGVLRDPGGAVVAVAKAPRPTALAVVWHHLSTLDVQRATDAYVALFGWQVTERAQVGPYVIDQFAWEAGGPHAGSIENITGKDGRHPHWLFHFPTADLDRAVAYVRARGGLALEPMRAPDGDRVAVCDDPQGAAFALREPA